ncbi:MAG: NUDIX domain-containing protein [Patescibacteria group bacterium]|jgi:tRNA nucleotidyltransferase (CCA-adding enzyme)
MEQRSFGVVPIYREGNQIKFLLVRHNVGHWSFPKGHPEGDETEIESALRELLEETSISEVKLVPEWSATENYQFRGHGTEGIIHKTVKYFLGWVGDPTVKILEEELRDYRWVTPEEARKLISFPAAQQVLDQALTYLGQNPASA